MARRQSVLLLALTAITIAVGAWLVLPPGTPLPGRLHAGLAADAGASRGDSAEGPTNGLGDAAVRGATEAAEASGLRIRIPAIAVDAPITRLRPDEDAARLPAPDAPSVVGILRGAAGSSGEHSLLVGHLNWRTGEPAVFERLTDVAFGDTIILQQRGEERAYRVTSVRDVDAFTTSLTDVLGSGERDTITLMTCTGEFLWNVGAYAERRIVLAVLVEV